MGRRKTVIKTVNENDIYKMIAIANNTEQRTVKDIFESFYSLCEIALLNGYEIDIPKLLKIEMKKKYLDDTIDKRLSNSNKSHCYIPKIELPSVLKEKIMNRKHNHG